MLQYKISGGILLFFIAFEMINAQQSRSKQTDEEQLEGSKKDDIAVFPLGIPLLAGPGAIVSVFVLADQATTVTKQISLYSAIAISGLAVYLTLREAHRLNRLMGQTGINVMSRLMGVVLAAISVQFVIDGAIAAMPGLAR